MKFNDTAYGFVPHGGQTYLLSWMPGETGLFLALTGWEMNGADALELKIADIMTPTIPLWSIMDDQRIALKIYKEFEKTEMVWGYMYQQQHDWEGRHNKYAWEAID